MTVVIVTDRPLKEIWADEDFALEEARCSRVKDLQKLKELAARSKTDVFIFDLDRIHLDDRQVRNIKKRHPEVELLIVSGRSCHPELKEALRSHIFACLSKPLDSEELVFCLKSIHEKRRLLAPD